MIDVPSTTAEIANMHTHSDLLRQSGLLALVLALASLSGCAIVAQREQNEIGAWCDDKMRGDPAMTAIRTKLGLWTNPTITFDMLTISDIPTDDEVRAIRHKQVIAEECWARSLSSLSSNSPRSVSATEIYKMKLDLVTARLVEKTISYGNANRLYKEARIAYIEAIGRVNAQTSNEAAQLLALQALLQNTNQQQSTLTTCNWAGTTLTCRSF